MRTMSIKYYKVYQRYRDRKIFGFPLNSKPSNYSLRKLKRRLMSNKKNWNLFLHLTYNNNWVDYACGNDIRKLLNNVRQFNRNKLRTVKDKRLREYYIERNKNFKYCWVVETSSTGIRQYNPHFHVLIESPFYLSRKKLQNWWGKGFVSLKTIKNSKKAIEYVLKYMVKGTKRKQWVGKQWSHSRNLPGDKRTSRYIGCLEESIYYEWRLLQKNYLLTGEYDKMFEKWAKKNRNLGRIPLDYSRRIIDKDNYEFLQYQFDTKTGHYDPNI